MISSPRLPLLIIVAVLFGSLAFAFKAGTGDVGATGSCTSLRLDAASNPLNPPAGSDVLYRTRLRTVGDCTNATIVFTGHKGSVINSIDAPAPWECSATANVVTCTTGETCVTESDVTECTLDVAPARTLITINAYREEYIGPASTKPKATAWADGAGPVTATAQQTLP